MHEWLKSKTISSKTVQTLRMATWSRCKFVMRRMDSEGKILTCETPLARFWQKLKTAVTANSRNNYTMTDYSPKNKPKHTTFIKRDTEP